MVRNAVRFVAVALVSVAAFGFTSARSEAQVLVLQPGLVGPNVVVPSYVYPPTYVYPRVTPFYPSVGPVYYNYYYTPRGYAYSYYAPYYNGPAYSYSYSNGPGNRYGYSYNIYP